jgi:thiol-disulfide isomerase/thioredoxin
MKTVFSALLLVTIFFSTAGGAGLPVVSTGDLEDIVAAEKGRVVVLNFWASWCGPCKREIPELVEMRREYPEDAVTIIGVSMDHDPAMMHEYLDKQEVNYPLYLGTQQVGIDYAVAGIPKLLVYDQSGEVAFTFEGLIRPAMLHRIVDNLLEE